MRCIQRFGTASKRYRRLQQGHRDEAGSDSIVDNKNKNPFKKKQECSVFLNPPVLTS